MWGMSVQASLSVQQADVRSCTQRLPRTNSPLGFTLGFGPSEAIKTFFAKAIGPGPAAPRTDRGFPHKIHDLHDQPSIA